MFITLKLSSLTQIKRITCAYLAPLIFLLMINVGSAIGQVNEIKLAHEYFANNELNKAKILYEKLAKKSENLPLIYNDYSTTLLSLKEYAQLEKFVKKAVKENPSNVFFKIDHFVVLSDYLNNNAEKIQKEIESHIEQNPADSKRIADAFVKKGKIEKAISTYKVARRTSKNKHLYSMELAELYKSMNQEDLMIEELLGFLKAFPENLESIKNALQNDISDQKGFEKLENMLYEKIQKEPEEITYNEVLLWLNIQQKQFGKAFIQAKAIDKRNKSEGNKLLEVGRIALENKDYEDATRFFQTICNDYKTGLNYPIARRLLLNTKEELIKNTYPVNRSNINSLLQDYRVLINELGKKPSTLEAMRNMALLEAFYLDKKDTALILLNEAVSFANRDEIFIAKAKLDMGDIYLLKEEPWEATLLFSQVEKSQKDEVLGHEAKLRNAKLSYYKGEFELAQEHLDVLKLATSREIANDAMNLSILIQDNLALDTTSEALKEYASVDLLLFQNKIDLAITNLEEMQAKYKGHALSDEILFLKAKIYKKQAKYEKAIEALKEIESDYSEDILGDDALFLLGAIYEENMKDKDSAMGIYQKFLTKYPGSIFNVEARKRFRILRGDKL